MMAFQYKSKARQEVVAFLCCTIKKVNQTIMRVPLTCLYKGLPLFCALTLYSLSPVKSQNPETESQSLEVSHGNVQQPMQESQTHKIVFHLMTGSERDRAGLLRNIRNVLREWPEARIKVVSHSGGIALLTQEGNTLVQEIDVLHQKGVTFNACENTMASKSIARGDLVSAAETIPSGIVEVVKLQEQGYAYIRAGY